jgi:hypothetical protein
MTAHNVAVAMACFGFGLLLAGMVIDRPRVRFTGSFLLVSAALLNAGAFASIG